MKKRFIYLPILLSLFLSSCAISFNNENPNNNDPHNNNNNPNADDPNNNKGDEEAEEDNDYEDIEEIDYSTFTIKTSDGKFSQNESIYTISKAGTYDLSGTLEEGNIIVEADEDATITLNLNNVSISSSTNSPIYIISADEVKIYNNKEYSNVIIDKRSLKTSDDDAQGGAAIYAKCDMSITGKGTLEVKASYNNGIGTTKDLKIKNVNLTVNSVNNCLKGNDSVEIKSGDILLISTGGNGIVSEDSDISSKQNQRGNIDISGGEIDIYSAKDAIDASYNVNITSSINDDNSVNIPKINIYTANYSSYSGEITTNDEGTYYLKSKSNLASNYRFSVYYLESEVGKWANATYFTSQREGGGYGGGYTYYYYKFNMPSSVSSFTIYSFNSNDVNSLENYISKSESLTINTHYDTLVISSTSGQIHTSSWTTYKTQSNFGPGGGPGGNNDGNSDKLSYSAKGIKANNAITIDNANLYIKAYDDAIHANYGETLENGETGVGDVIINDGTIEIYSADDALHADRYLNINGGDITITSSYEALEANVINVNGGNIILYATDDGLNAAKKANLTPLINITSGFIDITVGSGDTDGIDSNGNFTQSGGIAISRGNNGNMSTGLDCDGTATVKGGTLILFGKPEKTPTRGTGVYAQTLTGTFSAKTYTFTCQDTTFKTTNQRSFTNVYIYSDVGNTFSIS